MRNIAAAVLLLVVSQLSSQDAPSLGDVARSARAEKGKTAAPAPAPMPSAPSNPAASDTPASAPVTRPAPAPSLPAQDSQRVADQRAQDGELNLHEISRYQDQIRGFFNLESFDKIDQIAEKERTGKTRLRGGFWSIHLLYEALEAPPHGMFDSTESEWKILFDRLQRWSAQQPQSVTARIALARAYLGYAWNARSSGYGNTVTEEGWRAFAERSQQAGKILIEAYNLPTKDPEWFLAMQQVIQAQDLGKDKEAAMFEKAIAFEPDYQYYYRAQADLLLPQWGGEEGQVAVFAQQTADRIGGKKGEMIYFQIAVHVNCQCGAENQPNGMSWPRIKRGFAAVEDEYGHSLVNDNQMAKFAAAAGDAAYAHELFVRIGDNWDPEAWGERKNFEGVRGWTEVTQQIKNIQEQGPKTAENNMKTEEGRQFGEEVGKVFRSNYSEKLSACRTLAQEKAPAAFDLFMEIQKTGVVEAVLASPMTKTAFCMQGIVSSGRFPIPPGPSYWVKFTVPAQP